MKGLRNSALRSQMVPATDFESPFVLPEPGGGCGDGRHEVHHVPNQLVAHLEACPKGPGKPLLSGKFSSCKGALQFSETQRLYFLAFSPSVINW